MMTRPKAARELIAFYLDAGVDALVGETPIDRMGDDIAPQRATAAASPSSGTQITLPSSIEKSIAACALGNRSL